MRIRKRRSDRSGRAPLPSPGRPPVAGRDERRRFWAAIAAGLASEDAAVEAGVSQAVGTRWFRKAGGMPPAMFGLSAKPLSGRYLSLAEREEIALLRVQDHSMQEIARRLGRAASTISRELRRNAATRSGGLEYRATTAQWHAERSARRPKQTKLVLNAALRIYVEERLAGVVAASSGASVPGPDVSWKGRRHGPRQDRRWARAWSPEQIARRLLVDFPDDGAMRISHEAIYQALFVQARGALRRELTACLRTGRPLRVPRARTRAAVRPNRSARGRRCDPRTRDGSQAGRRRRVEGRASGPRWRRAHSRSARRCRCRAGQEGMEYAVSCRKPYAVLAAARWFCNAVPARITCQMAVLFRWCRYRAANPGLRHDLCAGRWPAHHPPEPQ